MISPKNEGNSPFKEQTCVRAEYWDGACGVRTYIGHELQFHGLLAYEGLTINIAMLE